MNKFQLILGRDNNQEGIDANNQMHNVYFDNRPSNLLHVFNCGPNPSVCPVPYPDGPYPVLLFFWQFDDTNAVEVYRMRSPITENRIREKLKELEDADLSKFLNEGVPAVDEAGDGGNQGQNSPVPLFGLGLFNLNLPIPWWLWAILAAVAAERASSKKSTLLGFAALVAAINAYNKKKHG